MRDGFLTDDMGLGKVSDCLDQYALTVEVSSANFADYIDAYRDAGQYLD